VVFHRGRVLGLGGVRNAGGARGACKGGGAGNCGFRPTKLGEQKGEGLIILKGKWGRGHSSLEIWGAAAQGNTQDKEECLRSGCGTGTHLCRGKPWGGGRRNWENDSMRMGGHREPKKGKKKGKGTNYRLRTKKKRGEKGENGCRAESCYRERGGPPCGQKEGNLTSFDSGTGGVGGDGGKVMGLEKNKMGKTGVKSDTSQKMKDWEKSASVEKEPCAMKGA